MISVPLDTSITRSSAEMFRPSLVQITLGFGTPLTSQVIIIVAPFRASTFEPTPAVTRLWSSEMMEPCGGRISGSRGSDKETGLVWYCDERGVLI